MKGLKNERKNREKNDNPLVKKGYCASALTYRQVCFIFLLTTTTLLVKYCHRRKFEIEKPNKEILPLVSLQPSPIFPKLMHKLITINKAGSLSLDLFQHQSIGLNKKIQI